MGGPLRSTAMDRSPDGRWTRRHVLRTGALASAVGTIAGCSGSSSDEPDGGDDGTDPGTPADSNEVPTTTQAASDEPRPPGADVLGGPDDLQSRAEVRATVFEEDQGAGRHVFTPAVVWLEPGGTVVWSFEEGEHTVTAYHPQYDKPQRVPTGVDTPFNSEFAGVGEPGTSFNFVFETEGVWNYFCEPHEGRGMVGLVVVGGPRAQGGLTRPDDVESEAAAEKLTRLVESGGIVEED